MKKLTEEQAWKVLQVVFSRRRGFCCALEYLEGTGLLSVDTRWRMTTRFSKLPNVPSAENQGWPYFKFPATFVAGNPVRVLFAKRQAGLSRRRKKR